MLDGEVAQGQPDQQVCDECLKLIERRRSAVVGVRSHMSSQEEGCTRFWSEWKMDSRSCQNQEAHQTGLM